MLFRSAMKRFDTEGTDAAVPPLLAGLRAVRVLRARIRALSLDEGSRFEIEFRLRQKEREFQQAAVLASGLQVEVLADDGVVVPGQAVKVSVLIANHGAADVTLKQVKLDGFEGDTGCSPTLVAGGGPSLDRQPGRGRGSAPPPIPPGSPVSTLKKDQVAGCEPTLRVPTSTRITEPYWHRDGEAGRYTFDDDAPFGLPFRPTSFYVQVTIGFADGAEVFHGLPVQFRYYGDSFSGEKRTELLVVPPFSVRVSPETGIIPAGAPAPAPPPQPAAAIQKPPARPIPAPAPTPTSPPRGRGARPAAPAAKPPEPAPQRVLAEREVRVTVVNDTKGEADATVNLKIPTGWTAMPREQTVKFSRENESKTIRFQIRPAPNTAPGEYHVAASVKKIGRAHV